MNTPTKTISTFIFAACIVTLSASAFAGEVLDRITKAGVIKVANDANWAPQSFLNDNNEMDGFDVDVAKDIAKRMGVKIKFVNPDWNVITAGKWSGRWDASIGSMTPTPDRAKVLNFAAVYYYIPAAAAVHKDSSAQKPSDLSGKVIGVTPNTTHENYVEHDLEIFNGPKVIYRITPSKLHSQENTTVLLDGLRLGDGVRMDGLVGEMPTLLEAIKNNYPIRILQPPVFYEPLAVAIELGDKEFNDTIAKIISDMHADGTLSRLSKKWYDVDYTKAQ